MGRQNSIAIIKQILGLSDSTIRQIGIGPLMTQVAQKLGMEGVTRCDADSGQTDQYTGDLEKDITPRLPKRSRR